MPSQRDIKLGEYNIGKFAYRELHNFCLQYPEKKRQLAEYRSPYTSPQITGLPHGTQIADQTGKAAERAAMLSADCELIEQTALEVSVEDYQCIILAVTQDIPWYHLQLLRGLETARDKFNEERRLFYYLLAKRKKII